MFFSATISPLIVEVVIKRKRFLVAETKLVNAPHVIQMNCMDSTLWIENTKGPLTDAGEQTVATSAASGGDRTSSGAPCMIFM